MRGAHSNFPINGQSKRQDCVSHCTTKAEIVAADVAIRREGIPALDLWDVIAPGHGPLVFHEDNQAMTRVCRTGKNLVMRNLLRSHAVCVAYLHELFQRPENQLQHEQSERQATDFYTRAFHNVDAWEHILRLIGAGDSAAMSVSAESVSGRTRPRPRLPSGRPPHRLDAGGR